MRMPFGRTGSTRLLQASALLTLLALVLMSWALVDPTVLPVMLAMSAGQAIGTAALALYVFVIVRDLRRDRSQGDSLAPPMGEPRAGLPVIPVALSPAPTPATPTTTPAEPMHPAERP